MTTETPTPPDEASIRQKAKEAGAQAAYEYLAPFQGFRTSSMETEAQRLAQIAEGRVLAQHGMLEPRELPAVQAIFDEAQRISDEIFSSVFRSEAGYIETQASNHEALGVQAREEHLRKFGLLMSEKN